MYRSDKRGEFMQSGIDIENEFSILKKIQLSLNTIGFHIHMDEAGLKICHPNDHTLLFTTGVGPCIAALIFCQLKDGRKLIGIAHLCASSDDFIRDHFDYNRVSDEEIKRAIPFIYRPKHLTPLLNSIYNHENYNGELINICFAGGRESELSRHIIKYYCAYVNSLKNTKVKVIFDPIGKYIQQYSNENTDIKLSLTAGISTNGDILLSIHRHPFFLDSSSSSLVPGFSNYYKFQLEKHMKSQTVEEKKGVLLISNQSNYGLIDVDELHMRYIKN